jgi:glutathione reductase (NADPH)
VSSRPIPADEECFQRADRARLYKLVVDGATDRILGIHMIGPCARNSSGGGDRGEGGLTKADFDATVALHPSMAEELVLMR